MATTVLVVDDHASFRRVARLLLQFEGYEVVGEAEDGLSGLAAARALAPDLVLLDIQPPDIDGFDVAARLTSDERAPAVILTSSQDGDVGLVRLPDPPAARVPRGPPPGAAREGLAPAISRACSGSTTPVGSPRGCRCSCSWCCSGCRWITTRLSWLPRISHEPAAEGARA